MPAGVTYEPIATTTLNSTTSFTFSSIPSTYTDLILVVNGVVSSGTSNLNLRFNSDSGSNYSYTQLAADGATVLSSRQTNSTYARVDYYGYLSTTRSIHIVHIMNYSNTTTFKTAISRANNTSNGLSAVVNVWRSTAAINSVSSANVTDLGSGSVITLYGITAA